MVNTRAAITAAEFWRVFAECLHTALVAAPGWRDTYSSDKRWTAFVREVIRDACGRMKFGATPGSYTLEDFRIDFCCFSFAPLEQCTEHQNWDLEIAIEHENHARSWLHEWVKLAHLNCGLRVVISYSGEPSGFLQDSTLMNQAIILAQARRYSPREGNWLLILGPTFKALQRHGGDFAAYSFDGAAFRQLNDFPVLRELHQNDRPMQSTCEDARA